jgi:hypothetical protein
MSPMVWWSIHGPTTTYMGMDGLHNHQFNYLEVGSLLLNLRDFAIKNSRSSGISMNEGLCTFHIKSYSYKNDTSSDAVKIAIWSAFLLYLSP